jgi:hypothetical protein
MDVILFTGPSLPPHLAAQRLSATCRPPVSQGDVYRASLERPSIIGIIDGYFRSVPSVWHKEILWALSQGITVYGSASMGALRAAELAVFGVIGVGWIYEAFRDGRLIDDDEVAVEHGPAELGYACTSEAMVNIRRTLSAAEHHGIISSVTRRSLENYAKSLYYPMRTYSNILSGTPGVARSEIRAFSAWLPSGQINQKRDDAVSMLAEIEKAVVSGVRPDPVDFVFEPTDMWAHAIKMVPTSDA